MYLRHATLHLPLHRQYPQPNASIFRSHVRPDDLFLHLLVNLYSALNTFDPTMAYLDQDQISRLLLVLYRYARLGIDCFGWCWRYLDEERVGYWK
jgi:hypothetical protein